MDQLVGFCKGSKTNRGTESTGKISPLPLNPLKKHLEKHLEKHTQVVSFDEDDVVCSTLQSLEAPLLFGPRGFQLSYFLFQCSINILLLLLFFTVASTILFKLWGNKTSHRVKGSGLFAVVSVKPKHNSGPNLISKTPSVVRSPSLVRTTCRRTH